MAKYLIGKKIGMSRIFGEDGTATPVTLIQTGELEVVRIEMKDNGTDAIIQVKGRKDFDHADKEVKKNNIILTSFVTDAPESYKVGDNLNINLLTDLSKVDVRATSKGKGFAGTIKRHHFHRGPKTHGSHNVRQPGSIGSMFPQRVIKGRKMPGRLGGGHITAKNLRVVEIIPDKNILVVKGAVPGINKALVEIKG